MLFKKKQSNTDNINTNKKKKQQTKVVEKFKKDSNPPSLTLYTVYPCPTGNPQDFIDTPSDQDDSAAVYIAPSYEDALYAVERLIFLNHSTHFLQWCEVRNLIPDFSTVWNQYTAATLIDETGYYADPADRFLIAQAKFSFEDLVGFVRSFYDIKPLLIENTCLAELKKVKETTGTIPEFYEDLAKADETAKEALKIFHEKVK